MFAQSKSDARSFELKSLNLKMLQKFKDHLEKNFAFLKNQKLLLATSGGLDSMVMVSLFHQLSFNIALAHCNFQLRGLESIEDENFVNKFAVSHKIPLFKTQFDTTAFATDFKLSTQVAARELRYNWFYELVRKENFDYILTAHHADDTIETFLINLTRGTGLEGLTGIPSQNEKVIRPLLAFSQQEIADFAEKNNISWREDSSNASDYYLRNKIRHKIVPLLKELNPDFLNTFLKTQTYLQDAQTLVEDASIMVYQQVAKEVNDQIHFDLKQLRRLQNYKSYLYQWLKEFGFSAWHDIYDLVEAQSGKQIFAKKFRLLKDRDVLILCPINNLIEVRQFLIEKHQREVKVPINLSISHTDATSISGIETIFVDEALLQFPLKLGKWNSGDTFQPIGMEGKSKKVSKFFKDEKLTLFEKEEVWILFSNNQIVWIIGIRQDERFKISDTTKSILKIQLI